MGYPQLALDIYKLPAFFCACFRHIICLEHATWSSWFTFIFMYTYYLGHEKGSNLQKLPNKVVQCNEKFIWCWFLPTKCIHFLISGSLIKDINYYYYKYIHPLQQQCIHQLCIHLKLSRERRPPPTHTIMFTITTNWSQKEAPLKLSLHQRQNQYLIQGSRPFLMKTVLMLVFF